MIDVTRINGSRMVLNAEMIETVEANPDTIITLVNGHKYLVTETIEDVIRLVRGYKQSILLRPEVKE